MQNKQFSVSEAAKYLFLSRSKILNMIRDKELKADRIGNQWVLKEDDLAEVFVKRYPGMKRVNHATD
jgi:excisionase family DNA binding protein